MNPDATTEKGSSERTDKMKKSRSSVWSQILPLLRRSRSRERTNEKSRYCGIHVASPKYNEFASKYLDADGKIRPEISNVILSRPHVKGVSVSYDSVNRRWGFDVCIEDLAMAKVVVADGKLSSYPCRIVGTTS